MSRPQKDTLLNSKKPSKKKRKTIVKFLNNDIAPRIITGKFKNAALCFYKTDAKSGVRAVTKRAREMVFSWLCTRLMKKNTVEIHAISTASQPSGSTIFEGFNVVDCFAGFGSYGFEALSRGADHCLFIEKDSLQQKFILETAKRFNIGNDFMDVWTGSLPQSLNYMPYAKQAHVLFIAPPYAQVEIGEAVLERWPTAAYAEKSYAIFEGHKTYDFPEEINNNWFLMESRKCGLAKIGFYCTDITERKEKRVYNPNENTDDEVVI